MGVGFARLDLGPAASDAGPVVLRFLGARRRRNAVRRMVCVLVGVYFGGYVYVISAVGWALGGPRGECPAGAGRL
eukprot:3773825-Alexandrium_andersonii.AAC.1